MMRFTPSTPRRAFHQPPGRENARSQVEYAAITATVAQATDKALLLTNEHIVPPAWVPRFRLDTVSRARSTNFVRSQVVTVQVELEFALEQNLV